MAAKVGCALVGARDVSGRGEDRGVVGELRGDCPNAPLGLGTKSCRVFCIIGDNKLLVLLDGEVQRFTRGFNTSVARRS